LLKETRRKEKKMRVEVQDVASSSQQLKKRLVIRIITHFHSPPVVLLLPFFQESKSQESKVVEHKTKYIFPPTPQEESLSGSTKARETSFISPTSSSPSIEFEKCAWNFKENTVKVREGEGRTKESSWNFIPFRQTNFSSLPVRNRTCSFARTRFLFSW